MKVLLVVPPGGYYAERWRHGVLMPPLGVTSLATFLRANGVDAEILDAHVERLTWPKLRARMRSARPQIVGVTFTTETRFQGFRAIEIAKAALPDTLVVAGGPHASLAAGDTLRTVNALDVIVRGEGEQTLLELARSIDRGRGPQSLDGITFRCDGEVVSAPERRPIDDLDALAIPDRSLLPFANYNFGFDVPGEGWRAAANLITSRGCPFGCCFCASSELWGRRVRHHSPERVVEEARLLVETMGVRALWFCDDTFTLDRERVRRICDLLRRSLPDVRWFCEVRSGTVDRDLLGEMREAGCCRIGIGVESGSQKLLDETTGKRIRIEQAMELTSSCKELGIVAHPFFILGHPGETMVEARKTMRLVRKLDKDHEVSISLMHIYPGTRLETMAREKGILPPDFSWADTRVRGVTVLPSVQGDAPIFTDCMTWREMSELLSEWRGIRRYMKLTELPRLLGGIRSARDVEQLMVGARSFLLRPLRRVLMRAPILSLVRMAVNRFGPGEATLSSFPMRLWIEPTNVCNRRCAVCPQATTPEMERGYMEFDLFRKVVDQAANRVYDMTMHHRGESLLHPDIFRMLEYAIERDMRVRLHTNGTVLDEDRAARLLDTGLNFLSFSCRDVDDTIGNMRRFLEMKRARGLQKPFTQIEIIDLGADSASLKRRIQDEFRSLPLDRVVLKKAHNWAGALPGNRGDVQGRTPCLFPWFALVVFWNGDVVTCPQDFLGTLRLGNVCDLSLQELWQGERLREIRSLMRRRRFGELIPCRRCDMLARPGVFGVPWSGMATALDDLLPRCGER